MAQITINEVSQNYTYNVSDNSFATVALPITSCWGPGYFGDANDHNPKSEDALENTTWTKFPATQKGLESFVSTYRGPSQNYRLVKDYSYQIAMTLLTAGYDVLVCRLCPGNRSDKTTKLNILTKDATLKYPLDLSSYITGAEGSKKIDDKILNSLNDTELVIKAKYPGSFGNSIRVKLIKMSRYLNGQASPYWNCITYIVDTSGVQTAVENIKFVFDINHADDNILYIDEIESDFIEFGKHPNTDDIDIQYQFILKTTSANKNEESTLKLISKDEAIEFAKNLKENQTLELAESINSDYTIDLSDGNDKSEDATDGHEAIQDAITYAGIRYTGDDVSSDYIQKLKSFNEKHEVDGIEEYINSVDISFANTVRHNEWLYSSAYEVYELLKDRLTYNPNRVISPGWDDQDFNSIDPDSNASISTVTFTISPLHKKLMDVAYFSRCATALLDIPKTLPKSKIYDESTKASEGGYAQKLARFQPDNKENNINTSLYSTHSALFAPWGQYKYVGTNKQAKASPSFLALMIQRAMILNQPAQYEWALPTSRKHNLKLGKMDYPVRKHSLDEWQKLEGVGVNAITEIPDLGISLWGNSTLFEVPPATYQALANLSTRYLMNAIEDVVFRVGMSITFQYNNDQAYSRFYAGVTPTLDTMKNMGAIDGYYVKMSSDVDGLDQVNQNTVIGKIYLTINGVVNDINVDLIALPTSVDLNQFK